VKFKDELFIPLSHFNESDLRFLVTNGRGSDIVRHFFLPDENNENFKVRGYYPAEQLYENLYNYNPKNKKAIKRRVAMLERLEKFIFEEGLD
jgi:hypothetical protein